MAAHPELLSDAECVRHMDQPGVRVVLSVPKGPAWTRIWTWREFFSGLVPTWIYAHNGPPWMKLSEFDGPEDPMLPMEFHGHVEQEDLEEAHAMLWPK